MLFSKGVMGRKWGPGGIMGLVLDTGLVILRTSAFSCPESNCQHKGGVKDWGVGNITQGDFIQKQKRAVEGNLEIIIKNKNLCIYLLPVSRGKQIWYLGSKQIRYFPSGLCQVLIYVILI